MRFSHVLQHGVFKSIDLTRLPTLEDKPNHFLFPKQSYGKMKVTFQQKWFERWRWLH